MASPLNQSNRWFFTVVCREADRLTIQADNGERATVGAQETALHSEAAVFLFGSRYYTLFAFREAGEDSPLSGSRFTLA